MPFNPRVLVCSLAVASLAISGVVAQRGPTPDEPVAIDFYAIGSEGPVFDLRIDEVTIKIDGRARKVRSLRYIPLPMSDPAALDGPPDLEPAFGTNQVEANGRWVTIVIDHESIRPGTERDAVSAVIRMIRQLGPRDRVSYVTMPNGALEVEFTEKHDQVIEALRRFRATGQREPTEQERSCRTRTLLNSLSHYIEGLEPLEGPKQIVLVSTGMLNPRRDAPMLGPPGPCEIRMVYYQEVSRAASLARASTFVVQPDDVSMDPARQVFVDPTASRFAAADEDRAGLESLAGVTGGEFMRIIGPEDNTLLNHVRGSAGYYIATVEPDAGERNGAPHRVEVNVARDKVRVRTRPEVFIPRRPGTTTKAPSAPEMLRNGVFYRALPLRVTAVPSASDPGRIKILTVLDSPEPDVQFTQAVFGIIDERDKLVAQWTANDRERGTTPVVTAGEGAPGTYRLRVAAIDESGRRGTAEYPLIAQLTEAGALTTSGLALGVSRDGTFNPKMVFGSDQAAVTYLEIYGRAPKTDSITVRIEVAPTNDGRALVTGAGRIVPQQDDRRVMIGALPIAALAPGDYVVRAIVSVDGRPVGRVFRTLRKSAAGS